MASHTKLTVVPSMTGPAGLNLEVTYGTAIRKKLMILRKFEEGREGGGKPYMHACIIILQTYLQVRL